MSALDYFKDNIISKLTVQNFCLITVQNFCPVTAQKHTFNLQVWNLRLANYFAIALCVILRVLGRKGEATSNELFLEKIGSKQIFLFISCMEARQGLNEHDGFSKIYKISLLSRPTTLILKMWFDATGYLASHCSRWEDKMLCACRLNKNQESIPEESWRLGPYHALNA